MKTHCLRSLVGASSLAIAAIAASLVACSAEDATVLESEFAEEVEVGGLESSIPLEDKYDMELTADERARLDAYYASQGVPEDQVSYHGRVITLEGDLLVDADYILRDLELVEKGQVHAGGPGFGTGHLARCDGGVPVGNECPTGKFLFFRPWVDSKYHVVVNSAHQYYFDIINGAATAVENITNDDMGSTFFDVIKQADYDALPANQKNHRKIQVSINTSQCPSSPNAIACMEIPLITTEFGATRMRLGRTMGIRNDRMMSDTPDARGAIIHELLHAFGVGHMNFEMGAFKIYVPGTVKDSANPLSVMWSSTGNANWRNTLQSDDNDMMRTLFASGVTYVHAFSTVNAN
jgi:hypothetical protein